VHIHRCGLKKKTPIMRETWTKHMW
jgi:hypothetical protein